MRRYISPEIRTSTAHQHTVSAALVNTRKARALKAPLMSNDNQFLIRAAPSVFAKNISVLSVGLVLALIVDTPEYGEKPSQLVVRGANTQQEKITTARRYRKKSSFRNRMFLFADGS